MQQQREKGSGYREGQCKTHQKKVTHNSASTNIYANTDSTKSDVIVLGVGGGGGGYPPIFLKQPGGQAKTSNIC
jgi:hypothetical protein